MVGSGSSKDLDDPLTSLPSWGMKRAAAVATTDGERGDSPLGPAVQAGWPRRVAPAARMAEVPEGAAGTPNDTLEAAAGRLSPDAERGRGPPFGF